MKSLLGIAILGLIVGSTSPAKDKPESMSVKAYETFQKGLDARLTAMAEAEYAQQEEHLGILAKPFKIGEEVSVSVQQGPRRYLRSGEFKGIVEGKARIGSSQILMQDILQPDRDRLYYGENSHLLQQLLMQRRNMLNELKSSRVAGLRVTHLEDAGYSEAFFKKTVPIAGQFWFRQDLGEGRIQVTAERLEEDPVIRLTFRNEGTTPNEFLLIVNNKIRGSSAEMENGTVTYKDKVWTEKTLSILVSELGLDPFKTLGQNMTLWVFKAKAGSWRLLPSPEGHPSTTTSTKRLCPECYGSGKSVRIVAEKAEPITCPTCAGKGEVVGAEATYTRASYSFRLQAEWVREFDEAKFVQYSENVPSYVQMVEDALQAQKDQTRIARETMEKEAADRQAREQAEKELREKRTALIAKAESHFVWMTQEMIDQVEVDDVKYRLAKNHQMVGFPFPTHVNEAAVSRISEWEKVKTDKRRFGNEKYEFMNLEFRCIKLTGTDGEVQFMVQYQLNVTSLGTDSPKLNPKLTIKSKTGTESSWQDDFSIVSGFTGLITGGQTLTAEQLKDGVDTVTFDVQ